MAHLTQPVFIATNDTDEPLVIYGPSDEPFLRIANGRIETNTHSPLTYSTRGPEGVHFEGPETIDPEAAPVWRLVGRGNSWSWFDPRIRKSERASETWDIRAALGANRARSVTVVGSFESFDSHGHFDTRIESFPSIPGLEIQLHDGLVPAIYVRNQTDRALHVLGRSQEPFLRIGPRGVFGNLESLDYYRGGAQTIREVPPGVDPRDPPRWRKLSSVPIWSWLEFRARLPGSAHLRSTLGDARHPILRWTTPLILGEDPLSLVGRVEWIPPTEPAETATASASTWLWLLAFVVGVLVVFVLRWRLRDRSRAAGSLDPR